MATPQLSPQPVLDGSSLTGVANLASLFTPKSTATTQNTSQSSSSQNSGGISTDGTVTTSDNVSPDAVNALVKSILEGSQGLAAVSSGQARAGMYNSSTNQLLVSDLIARAAAEGAKLNKSSTTTTHNVQADSRTTNTNTNGTVNGTSATAAPISGGTAAKGVGILGALSLVPGDVRKGILDKLTLSSKGAGVGTANTAASVAPTATNATPANLSGTQVVNPLATPINDTGAANVAGIGSAPSIGVGQGTQTAGISMPDINAPQQSQSVPMPDSSGNIDLSNVDFGSSAGDSFVSDGGVSSDAGNGFSIDNSAVSGNTSSFIDPGQGDFGADVNAGGTDNIDYGDYFAADGGQVTSDGMARSPQTIFQRRKAALDDAEEAAVNGKDTNDAYQKSLTSGSASKSDDSSNSGANTDQKKSLLQRLIPSFAKGGMVKLNAKAPGYADGGMVDLTNVGLRHKADSLFSDAASIDAGSSVQSVNNAAIKALQTSTLSSPLDITPDTASANGGSDVVIGATTPTASPSKVGAGSTNSSGLGDEPNAIDSHMGDSSSDSLSDLYTNSGPRQGAGNLGLTSGEAGVAGTLLSLATGAPGSLVSMANASSNNQATNALFTAGASMLGGPVAGLVTSMLMKKFNPDGTPNTDFGTQPTDTSDIAGGMTSGADNNSDVQLTNEDTAMLTSNLNNFNNMNGTVGTDRGLKIFALANNNPKGDAFLRSQGYSSAQIDQMRLDGISAWRDVYGGYKDAAGFADEKALEGGFTKNSDGTYTNTRSAFGPITGSNSASGLDAPSANGSTGFVGGDTTEPAASPAEAPGGQFGGTAFAAEGGEINGPGTGTSDSIHAMLSDGEYVHTAKATNLFGTDFMDAVNDEDPVKAMSQLITSGLVSKQQVQKLAGGKNAKS